MADFFSEVDEEVRRDQAEALWARYGNFVIGGALIVILGISGFWGWQKYQEHRSVQAAEAYVEAIRAEGAKSQELLSNIAGQDGGFATLARLKLAADAVAAGDPEKAKGIFKSVADDAGVDPAIRGLASLKAGFLELESGKGAEAKALVANLDQDGNPYRHSAIEIMGLAELVQGNKVKAREIFTRLRDLAAGPPAMPVMQARAEQMLDRLAE